MKDTHNQQLNYFLRNKDYSTAETFLLSIKSEYPNDLDYWYFLVYIYRKLGRLVKAKNICQKAITQYPDSMQLNFELGIIFQKRGKYKEAIEYLKKAYQTKEDVSSDEIVDTLNSLALTYKMDGDYINAMKNYNLALEVLTQRIYEGIKNNPLRGADLQYEYIEFNYIEEKEEGWIGWAIKIAIKNAVNDGVRGARFPTGETAQKIILESPVIGVAIYDDNDKNRYILPAYFSSFYITLKSNIHYSNIYNNMGVLFAETDMIKEARNCYEESIRFIPKGVEYKSPFSNLEELEKTQQKTEKKFFVVPQTKEKIERNRKMIEELRAKGLLEKYEKTFKINEDGTVTEEKG